MTLTLFKRSMVMRIFSFKDDVVVGDDGSSTAQLILHACPASLRALTAAPLVKAVSPSHYHRVAKTGFFKPQMIHF